MARQSKLNPEGTLLGFGQNVRLERGFAVREDGTVGPDKDGNPPKPEWIVFRAVDVTEDTDTSYTYRFDEVRRFAEAEDAPGEPPQKAIDAALALAEQE